MFRFAKAAASVAARGTHQVAVRHQTNGPNFHRQYGNALLISGALFCAGVWGYVLTQTGITWNLSPIGKVTPKPWRE
ncbi:cytochrome c oxidase subunit 7B, mitochondrial [Paramormyrops kingsleyae]|uniref:cytochrome c oxidase subunit 7B, mitochondrial n=1 Tax=Paramormyrops kingsleyae TaxID=1676925 RepID=UPI000CD6522B|nr:cytochrome c oxidase subunit 7B, mitochondrial-like [Paramormyrops kingsleyae]